MQLSEFDYHLPEDRIAQRPLEDRAASRMLVLNRKEQRWEDRHFRELPLFLRPGDCLVLNDTRVFPSRLYGRRAGVAALPIGKNNPKREEYLSGEVEVFLLRPAAGDPGTWQALVHPGRKMRVGERVSFGGGLEAEVVARGAYGERTVRFNCGDDIYERLEQVGHVPLPPYIRRPDTPEDRLRYQTVFARETGSVAAPTAGLHFTPQVLEACRAAGAAAASVTLHVGLSTFQPIHGDVLEQHHLHSESFHITGDEARKMRAAVRLMPVGTTAVRTLETAMQRGGLEEVHGETGLFIYPGFQFQATGAMLTNFHLPRSSLLLLVCAFAGKELTLNAYRHAVEAGYRFYSYGDCMLII
ncbi:MAG: tRNA preQ1(34) S-adenosylmethionine ribosyltransferase-isomerase QueA [Acidobacteriales bacterium]|nr:MAG: tRNA preQ1(34) S-adenosylmethionine ribosyltransferase-isomerase QueA [Terriglobales bacterium]